MSEDKPSKSHTNLVTELIIVAVLIAAALTLPDQKAHEAELRRAVAQAIAAAPTRNTSDAVGKAFAGMINDSYRNDPNISYIDNMGLTYRKFLIFSVLENKKHEWCSFGVFNQVYVIDRLKK